MLISHFYQQMTGGKQKAYAVCAYSLEKCHTKCVTFILQRSKSHPSTEAATQRVCFSAENRTSVSESGASCAL